MRSLQDEFFDDPKFGNVSASDITVDNSFHSADDPEDWVFVRARTQSRDVMLYNEGIYRVLRCKSASPLTEEPVETVSEEEVLDRMPRQYRENMVVPSPSGGYLSVKEVTASENGDGTISVKTKGRTEKIPVEFVIEILTYDEVVVELLDNY